MENQNQNRNQLKRTKFLDGLSAGNIDKEQVRLKKQQSGDIAKEKRREGKEEDKRLRYLEDNHSRNFFDNRPKPNFAKEFLGQIPGLSLKSTFTGFILFFLIGFLGWGGYSLYSQAGQIAGKVKGAAYQGQSHLTKARQAVDEMDIIGASKEFELASAEIGQAADELKKKGQYNLYWHKLPYNKDSKSSLIRSVILIDQSIADLNNLYREFLEITQAGDFSNSRQKRISYQLKQTENNLDLLEKGLINLSNSKHFFPSQIESYTHDISLVKDQIVLIREVVNRSSDFLGYKNPKKYLLLFQNNAEPRPTGGFIGTFGYLTVDNGKISDLYLDEIYGPRDELRDTKLDSIKETRLGYPEDMPEDLIPNREIINEYTHSFYVQNTNCTPDFPETARRALWSFENVLNQSSASDVIAIDPGVVEEILKLTGSIKVNEHGVELNSENFRDIVQYKVEVDNPFKQDDREDYNPKQILVDFAPKLLKLITNSDMEIKAKIFASLITQAQDKHILFYSQDKNNQQFLQDRGLSGAIIRKNSDYLQINLDAQNATKSGLFLEKDYSLKTKIDDEGTINHNLKILLANQAQGQQSYYSDIELLVRVMIPYGSNLNRVIVDKKEVTEEIVSIGEAGKSSYLVPVEVKEKEKVEIFFDYQTNYFFDDIYHLVYQSQPGAIKTNFNWQLNLPKRYQLIDYSPKSLRFGNQSSLSFRGEEVKRDQEFKLKLIK
jgi:hypothetical protein